MGIRLRRFRDADLPLLRRWLSQAHVARWYGRPEDWLREVQHRDGEFSWLRHFIAECGGTPMGFCQFYEYCRGGETWHGDLDTRGAYSLDYLIGDAAYLGRGLGRALILALLEEVSAQGRPRLVIVRPEEENRASRAALRSAGFVFDQANGLFRLELTAGIDAGKEMS